MPRYVTQMPVFATVEYELVTKKPINDREALRQAMAERGTPCGSALCCRCYGKIDMSDGGPDLERWLISGGEVEEKETRTR